MRIPIVLPFVTWYTRRIGGWCYTIKQIHSICLHGALVAILTGVVADTLLLAETRLEGSHNGAWMNIWHRWWNKPSTRRREASILLWKPTLLWSDGDQRRGFSQGEEVGEDNQDDPANLIQITGTTDDAWERRSRKSNSNNRRYRRRINLSNV